MSVLNTNIERQRHKNGKLVKALFVQLQIYTKEDLLNITHKI